MPDERDATSFGSSLFRAARRVVRTFAVQDALIATYFTLLSIAVATGDGAEKSGAAWRVALDATFFAVGLFLSRGGILREGSLANGLVYRMGLLLAVFLSYFHLREIIPAVTSHERDAQLLALDLSVFGVEPAIAWDRFVTPHTTEWFSFFYFLYFFLLTGHVLPMLLAAKSRRRLAHFALGIFLVFCCGHLGYLVVSGWGPYRLLEGKFAHPLEGGLFYRLVMATVAAGGSQRDIFPSLHTACPTFFAIFAWQNRHALPWRYTWLPMAFTASQIIGATMFLRWHYLVDVLAGLTLAVLAAVVGQRVSQREAAYRRRRGLPRCSGSSRGPGETPIRPAGPPGDDDFPSRHRTSRKSHAKSLPGLRLLPRPTCRVRSVPRPRALGPRPSAAGTRLGQDARLEDT